MAAAELRAVHTMPSRRRPLALVAAGAESLMRTLRPRLRWRPGSTLAAALTAALAAAGPIAAQATPPAATSVASSAFAPFPDFESGPVNALLLSPDGTRLYALNTPDQRVEIYGTSAPAGGGTVPVTPGSARPMASATHS